MTQSLWEFLGKEPSGNLQALFSKPINQMWIDGNNFHLNLLESTREVERKFLKFFKTTDIIVNSTKKLRVQGEYVRTRNKEQAIIGSIWMDETCEYLHFINEYYEERKILLWDLWLVDNLGV